MAMLRSKIELRLCVNERCPLVDVGIAGLPALARTTYRFIRSLSIRATCDAL
jgi:hypothetical protein